MLYDDSIDLIDRLLLYADWGHCGFVAQARLAERITHRGVEGRSFLNTQEEDARAHINHKFRMKSYFINLDRSTDRLRRLRKMFREHGISSERFGAIDGRLVDLDDPRYKKRLTHLKTHFQTKPDLIGHLGCMLSHVEVLTRFLDDAQSEYCLVFEDDCTLKCDSFAQVVDESIEKARRIGFDMILFGYHIDKDFHKSHKTNNRHCVVQDGFIKYIKQFTGTHCYLVTRHGARTIIDGMTCPTWIYDWEISTIANQGGLKILGLFPPVACQPAINKIYFNEFDYKYNCPQTYKTLTNKW